MRHFLRPLLALLAMLAMASAPGIASAASASKPHPPIAFFWPYTATATSSRVPGLVVGRTYDLIHLDNITMEDIASAPVGRATLHVHVASSPDECLSSQTIDVFRFDGQLFLHDGDQGTMCTYATWEVAPASLLSPLQAPAITSTSPRPAPPGAVLAISGLRFDAPGLVQLIGYSATASGPVDRPPLLAYSPDRATVMLPAALRAGYYDVLLLTGAGAAATTLVRVAPSASTTWQQVPSPTTATLNAVSCVPAATPAGATTSYCYAVGDSGTIVFSDDGGLSWKSEASPTSADLRGISCYRLSGPGLRVPAACWAVGDGGTILYEKNGLAWVATPATPASSEPFEAVACQADGLRCWAVGLAVAAEYDSSLFPRTGWGLITVLGPPGSQCGPGGPNNACLRGVALGNTDEHFAVGGGGNVYAQLDYQGRSWSNQTSLGSGFFTSIACFPGSLAGHSRCITVGSDPSLARDRIYVTFDSGSSWLPVASPAEASLPVLRGVAVLRGHPLQAFAVGDGGTILHSLDAGRTWARETSPSTAGLEAVACPSTSRPPLVCVAVGQGGTILALR